VELVNKAKQIYQAAEKVAFRRTGRPDLIHARAEDCEATSQERSARIAGVCRIREGCYAVGVLPIKACTPVLR
jgi:hypothetical protein